MHPSWQNAAKQSLVYKKLAGKYQSPRGYAPWNDIVRTFGLVGDPDHLRRLQSTFGVNKDTKHIIECGVGAITAASLDAPAIYVDPVLTEAILCTEVSAMEPPELVLPAFFICVPFNTLFDDDGDTITSLLVVVQNKYLYTAIAMSDATDEYKKELIQHEVDAKNLQNLRVFAFTSKNAVISLTQRWDTGTAPAEDTSPIMYSPFIGHPLDEEPFRGMTPSIIKIVKNVILIYNYQKSYLEELPVKSNGTGFVKRKKYNKRDPLPVTLLGKNFLIRKKSVKTEPLSAQGGTVRPHWRKGHWHTVLTGAGRKDRRLRWFQPVYVNLTLDT